ASATSWYLKHSLHDALPILELLPPFHKGDAVQGLEQVSHVWLLFLFHQALEDKPRLKVRPPRLGGNQFVGVFSTRATHRPNGIRSEEHTSELQSRENIVCRL